MSMARLVEINELQRESRTDAKRVIDVSHAYIHDGRFYTAAAKLTMLAGAVLKITLKTPATTRVHFVPTTVSTSADKLSGLFYEGSTATDGSAMNVVNRDRNSTRATGVTLKSGATVSANGTLLTEFYLAGTTGVGQARVGSQSNGANEWILKPDTTYSYILTNGSSTENIVFMELQWYEESL